ncbi:hypothetical protein Bca101_043344 [Brassica carinata]
MLMLLGYDASPPAILSNLRRPALDDGAWFSGSPSQALISLPCKAVRRSEGCFMCGGKGSFLRFSEASCLQAPAKVVRLLPVVGFHTLDAIDCCSGHVYVVGSDLRSSDSAGFLSNCGCPASSLGLLIFRMWIGDWWMLWLRRFDAHGASWFFVLDLTPHLWLGASFLGSLFIQSRALGSTLSSAWSVLARSVETSLTLLILGKFLRP